MNLNHLPLIVIYLTFCVFVSGCAVKPKSVVPAGTISWQQKSDTLVKEFARDQAALFPEQVSDMGLREFDSQVIYLGNDLEQKQLELAMKWQSRLTQEILVEKDPELLTDLKILLAKNNEAIQGIAIDKNIGNIPFFPGSKFVFESLQTVINPQSDPQRKMSGVARFHKYILGDGIRVPILVAMKNLTLYKKQINSKRKFWPLKQEVEKYLSESAAYLAGIKKLLEESGVSQKDWELDFQSFQKQIQIYDKFIRKEVLSNARTNPQLPREVYTFVLKQKGIHATPESLIQIGLADYSVLYKEFQKLAVLVAKNRNLNKSDPASVMRELKKEKIADPASVHQLFSDANALMEKIILDHHLVSLPKSPLKIRIAGDAESKAAPVPHLVPPPIIGNRGERPEFVLPAASDGNLPFDDFSYRSAAFVLSAHEARPGHDLQFSTMLDRGTTLARQRYAMNSVNAEGWALYAEDLVYPYLTEEAKLVALQTRLWRVARMFLDPQLQLGQIKPQRVINVFTKELGVSEVMAGLEVNRYTYNDPGQAPSYYYGLKIIWAMKNRMKEKLAKNFNEKCFNDALLSYGLMPLDEISLRLENELVCTEVNK